ncbi:hypothetical protein NEISICOT_01700 [Neisseria sicca ATCC 29256]|uniref:Uncharacterized protein n=1 Tax=Neisseria sicca ATCC 29256 TaxID=547045 RepID=C6M5A1_NEISI|nr:hypothetical protein NEISICOT_01700 [Neisseria sicca ATCC 29256]
MHLLFYKGCRHSKFHDFRHKYQMCSNGTVKLVILRALLLKQKVFKNEKSTKF